MNFLRRLASKMQTFLYGRYGCDKLSYHLIWASFVACLISLFALRKVFSAVYILLFVFAVFRVFSKNNAKRNKELYAYEKFLSSIRNFFRLQKNKFKDRKTHKYFKCSCGAVLRVPKGKGEIIVHCPKCKKSTEKKT